MTERARRPAAHRWFQALRRSSGVILAMGTLACSGDGPTAPRELAARYVLVQHGGRALPVHAGTEVQRPAGETQGPGITCARELLATDLHFWPSSSWSEVAWRDSMQITCPDGAPVQFYRSDARGHTSDVGATFRITLYGLIDPPQWAVIHVRRNGDTLTVYRREAWRDKSRVGLDETLLVFVPSS